MIRCGVYRLHHGFGDGLIFVPTDVRPPTPEDSEEGALYLGKGEFDRNWILLGEFEFPEEFLAGLDEIDYPEGKIWEVYYHE